MFVKENWYGTDDKSAEDLNDDDFYPYHLQGVQSLLAGRLRHEFGIMEIAAVQAPIAACHWSRLGHVLHMLSVKLVLALGRSKIHMK
jgi:hypothetical protein